MCSGRNTFGNSTTFGSGKSGMVGGSIDRSRRRGRSSSLVNSPGLLVHVVHQHVLAERPRRREIRLAVANLGDLADEADEVMIACEHERVDEDTGLAARSHFRKRLGNDERIEAERVAIDAAVGTR